jgi:hypothetical protein
MKNVLNEVLATRLEISEFFFKNPLRNIFFNEQSCLKEQGWCGGSYCQ